MATATTEEASGKVVIKNIGLLLSGDIEHPILDADTIVVMDGLITAVAHMVIYLGLSGAVNGPGHWFGRKPYDNSATNQLWLALLTSGEGWHNNHHAHPQSARHGLRWYQVDLTWILIRMLNVFGLASNLQVAH